MINCQINFSLILLLGMQNKLLFFILNLCLATGNPGHWGNQPTNEGYQEYYGDKGDASIQTIDKTSFVTRCKLVNILITINREVKSTNYFDVPTPQTRFLR